MKTNRLIVALDVATALEARALLRRLRGLVGMFKVGSQLFTAAGPSLVREIIDSGERVFLDLKFHDIPNTVAAAGVEATRLGVSIFNLHAAGGSEMMRRTAAAVGECAQSEKLPRPAIIAVTVLTSTTAATLAEIGQGTEPADLVSRLALLAERSGLDGVVASPLEAELIRSTVKKPGFIIVTPGIRPAGSEAFDQKRLTTPRAAVFSGADYIVVGRPIIESPDPAEATREIVAELELASASTAGI